MGGMLALIAVAMFSSVRRGPQDLAEYAATLSQGQLCALGFRLDQHTGEIRCPGVTPFRTVLSGADASAVERALLRWQKQVLGPAQDPLVIVAGKTLRRAQVELVSAVNGQGRWLGTVPAIESRRHHALHVSLDEDRSRVRQPNAALVLAQAPRSWHLPVR